MFDKILVAVDGSSYAEEALDLAVDLAQRYHSSICLIHAFPHVSDLLGTPYHEHVHEARTLIGNELLDAASRQVGGTVPVELCLLEGPPAPAILKAAEDSHCDLIVVGSRGQGQLMGMLLGSVSTAVAQHASCPVMIVH